MKRILALAAVILWIGFIALTVVVALIDSELTNRIFPGMLFTVIVFPVVIYAMMMVYRILKGRK